MAAIARTIARYQHDAALRQLVTPVISFRSLESLPEGERILFSSVLETSDRVVATKETIFHAQGGGQPSDRGTITAKDNPQIRFDVKLVRKLPCGVILHAGTRVSGTDGDDEAEPFFREGQSVLLDIDNETRDYHSRLHTAGHLVGLAVRQLAEQIGPVSELKANHAPGSAFVEFKGLIDGAHKDSIQKAVDAMVSAALQVHVRWWNSQQVAEYCTSVPEAVGRPDANELMRAVEIEDRGAYPCGGTHLPTTADIGKVNIRRIRRQNGISKISYEVVT